MTSSTATVKGLLRCCSFRLNTRLSFFKIYTATLFKTAAILPPSVLTGSAMTLQQILLFYPKPSFIRGNLGPVSAIANTF
jgi:hypothetical protein